MEERRILIFGGTTEGRKLAEYLTKRGARVHVCVATAYGEQMLDKDEHLTVSAARMDETEMCTFLREFRPAYTVDATHPYAKEVTEHAKAACRACQVPYLRLLRAAEGEKERITAGSAAERGKGQITVGSVAEAVEALKQTSGNILVTTGSKELSAYTALPDYRERIYARVLPSEEGISACAQIGLTGRHVIGMQGPFSRELNLALLREYDISWMVTKESGKAGGYEEKWEAASQAGAGLVLVGRPEETEGLSFAEVCRFLTEKLELSPSWEVTLVGIGPGSLQGFTQEAREACKNAQLLIGASRMLQAAAQPGQETVSAYRPEEILAAIQSHPEWERVTVALSGDVGFYSGARKLQELLEREPQIRVRRIPGVSAIACFCAKLGISWEDAALVSMHGKRANVLSVVREHRHTLILAGNGNEIRRLGQDLMDSGLSGLRTAVGSALSYEEEIILQGDAGTLASYQGDALAVIYIENPRGGEGQSVHGLPDKAFLRGKTPMTKEEVRSVSLSKLQLRRNSVVYDVGAGTGSVAVEAALQAAKGQVFAVERTGEGQRLIRENARRFQVDNLTLIAGEAPDALADLPAPDCVFIGGSGGRLREILETVFEKNPRARVVLSAITLETVAEATACLKELDTEAEEIIQLSVARAEKAGPYHLMKGQNPIFLISVTGKGRNH